MRYKLRIADKLLARKLHTKGAVLVEGPKWCGKTTTCEQLAGSVLYLASPVSQHLQEMADVNIERLLEGPVPRLFDEWQEQPRLWDAVRWEVDHRQKPGQFIFTGSAVPVDKSKLVHSGTGRFSWVRMRTMSLFESGESNGSVSLSELFNSPEKLEGENKLTLEDISFLTCRGGWPQATFFEDDYALDMAVDYVEAIVNTDLSRVDGVKRNPERIRRLLASYARHQGGQVSVKTLQEDVQGSVAMSPDTVNSYLMALNNIFVIEEAQAWNPNLRSATAVRTSPTRYFTDPSIATAALGLGPGALMSDLPTFGLFFETLCIRDLRVYADSLGGEVSHFRTKGNLECDAVVHLRDGRYGLAEIKLGGEKAIEYGAATLLKVLGKIDTEKMGEPSFLMVLTAVGNYAFRRKDGVFVVPVGCLKD